MKQETKNPMPSLEEALELCKNIKRPLGLTAVLINTVTPDVGSSGIAYDEPTKKTRQKASNEQGMMVVLSPFTEDQKDNTYYVEPGELVLYGPHSNPLFTRVVKSEELLDNLVLQEGQVPTPKMYKKYLIFALPVHDLTVVLNRK